jgi:hypothetical protein
MRMTKKSYILNSSVRTIFLLSVSLISCKKYDSEKLSIPGEQVKNYTEILGRPTSSSVTMSILFDQNTEVYWEYGTVPGVYNKTSPAFQAAANTPVEVDFENLMANTRYYYRTRYRSSGVNSEFAAGEIHSFYTQRASGTTFSFAIEADPHLDANSDTAAYLLTLKNILSRNPDFLLDLGDTFFSEKQPIVNQSVITTRHTMYRPYFSVACSSSPIFLVLGNHEGEAGWQLNGTANNVAVMAANTRKLYYPNPEPNSFYSGNTNNEQFIGLQENYYSWEWGDALFIVLDPYWYTTDKPDWGWTLGREQYDWFTKVITCSKAKYKFIFCHQLVGGYGRDARGGAEYAGFFEMGGNNSDNSYGFDTYRSGWGKPIHTLMKENNATIFFHGHDHFYGKQDKDGIIYQEVPQPSNKNITNISASEYGYVNGEFLPGRGFLLITVSGESVKVEYIGTFLPAEAGGTHKNGDVIASYTIN